MEQLVARWAHNPKAVGSSPAPATQKLWHLCRSFFYGHIVEKKLFQFNPKQLFISNRNFSFYLIFPTEFFAVSCFVLAATTLYVPPSTRSPKNT